MSIYIHYIYLYIVEDSKGLFLDTNTTDYSSSIALKINIKSSGVKFDTAKQQDI